MFNPPDPTFGSGEISVNSPDPTLDIDCPRTVRANCLLRNVGKRGALNVPADLETKSHLTWGSFVSIARHYT